MLKEFDKDLKSLKSQDHSRGIRRIPIVQSSDSSSIDEREVKKKYLQMQKEKLQSI